jgi:hypothetical protein
LPKRERKLIREAIENIKKGKAKNWKTWENVKRELKVKI